MNNTGIERTQYYREVDFKKRKPNRKHDKYFCIIHAGGHTWDCGHIYVSEMEEHLKQYPDHTIDRLEPENEYDPDIYYTRISKT